MIKYDKHGILEKDYHYLELDEIIKMGDQCLGINNNWYLVEGSIGETRKKYIEDYLLPEFIVRRKLK